MVAPRLEITGQPARRTVWTADRGGSDAGEQSSVFERTDVEGNDSHMEHKYADDDDQQGADSADVTSSSLPPARPGPPQPNKRPRSQLTRRPRASLSAAKPSTSSPSSSATTAQPSAAAWFALHSQLAVQAHKLEREAALASRTPSWLWESGGRVEAEVADNNRQLLQWSRIEGRRQREREQEATLLHKSITRIRTALTPFLHNVRRQQRQSAKQQPSRAGGDGGMESEQQGSVVRELEQQMEGIEELLTRFKQEQKRLYLELDREEKEEEAECNMHLQRLQQWEAADVDTATRPHKPTGRHIIKPHATLGNTKSATSAPPALQSLDADIAAAGGATGGWSSVDHDLFVSCWHASASAVQCQQRMMVALPHKSSRQCEEHMRWWQTYKRWMDERKFVIAQWKESKKKEKERQRQREHDLEDEQHELEQQQRQQQADKEKEDKHEQAQSIAQWRHQRAQRREQDQKEREEQQRLSEQQKAKLREAYHQQQKHALVVAHAAQQQAQLELEARERVEREQQRQDNEKARQDAAKRLMLQHQADMTKKANERREREALREAADERRRRLLEESTAVVGVRAERDVGRLWARTEANEQRASEVKEELDSLHERRRQGKVGQMSMQPREVQSFMTPSWRQGL